MDVKKGFVFTFIKTLFMDLYTVMVNFIDVTLEFKR